MTLKDQADFLIADTGIHGGPLAWKLGASSGKDHKPMRVFSIRHITLFQQVANVDSAPAARTCGDVPISYDRTVFGGAPVSNGSGKRG